MNNDSPLISDIILAESALQQAMSALEEWCATDDEWVRTFQVEMEGTPAGLPWSVRIAYQVATEKVHGRTMADALAQAAQVVTSNPTLEP